MISFSYSAIQKKTTTGICVSYGLTCMQTVCQLAFYSLNDNHKFPFYISFIIHYEFKRKICVCVCGRVESSDDDDDMHSLDRVCVLSIHLNLKEVVES